MFLLAALKVADVLCVTRFCEVCDWLESYIDPFDLDVFTPPLNANLNRLSQRTSVRLSDTLSLLLDDHTECCPGLEPGCAASVFSADETCGFRCYWGF